jgi:hypothetical protein
MQIAMNWDVPTFKDIHPKINLLVLHPIIFHGKITIAFRYQLVKIRRMPKVYYMPPGVTRGKGAESESVRMSQISGCDVFGKRWVQRVYNNL